jgi:hypothetical protein
MVISPPARADRATSGKNKKTTTKFYAEKFAVAFNALTRAGST